jgi:hypothetical protein
VNNYFVTLFEFVCLYLFVMLFLPRRERLPLLRRKAEDIAFAVGECVTAGVFIAGLFSDSPNRYITIVAGLVTSCVFFVASYVFSIIKIK